MGNRESKSVLTEQIHLRKLEIADAEPMLAWMKTPDIYEKMQYDPEKQSLERCRGFIENSWSDSSNLHYAITNKDNEYLGTVSLKNIDEQNNNAELGIALCPRAMGQGCGSRALFEIMRVAFEEKKLHRVYWYVRTDNERAVRFYRKNRISEEGCFKGHIKIRGEYKDICWFGISEEEYREGICADK